MRTLFKLILFAAIVAGIVKGIFMYNTYRFNKMVEEEWYDCEVIFYNGDIERYKVPNPEACADDMMWIP